MTYQEAIKQLEDLIENSKSFSEENDDIWANDVEALEMAIEALEKQIPKKPVGKYTSYKCPVCGRRVRSGKGSSSRRIDHYRQKCGQAIDWSE